MPSVLIPGMTHITTATTTTDFIAQVLRSTFLSGIITDGTAGTDGIAGTADPGILPFTPPTDLEGITIHGGHLPITAMAIDTMPTIIITATATGTTGTPMPITILTTERPILMVNITVPEMPEVQ